MTTPNLVSASAYARLRGVTKQAVSKAIATGRIKLTPERLVDVDQANIDWAKNTDIGRQRQGAPQEFEKTQPLARASVAKQAGAAQPPKTDFVGSTLLEEKTRTERMRARIAELDLAEREGLMISRPTVVAALSTKLIAAAELLQAIPDRFAALFAAETNADAIHRVLTAEIQNAMKVIASAPDSMH